MDNIARAMRQRTWLFFGAGVALAVALGVSSLFTDDPPIGFYIVFWLLGLAAAGVVILLAYAQNTKATALFEQFQELSSVAIANHDPRLLIEKLGQALNSLYGLKLAAYQLHDEYGAPGQLQMASGVSLDRGLRNAVAEVMKSATREAYDSRAAVMRLKDELSVVQKGALEALKGKAFVVAPLAQDRSLVGIACFKGGRIRNLSLEKRQLIAKLGEEVAGAVGSGAQLQSSENSQQEAESYQDALTELAGKDNLDETLDALVRWVSRHARLDGASIALLDRNGGSMECVVSEGWLNGSGPRGSGDMGRSLIAQYVLELGEAVTVNDIQGASPDVPVNKELAEDLGVCCALAAPMMSGGRLIGVVTGVRATVERPFTHEDERRMAAAAGLAAIAAERARLDSAERERSGKFDKMAAFRSGIMHNVSHELRTSLSSLKAATDMLINEKAIQPGSDYYDRLLQSISRNVARQSALVSNIVDIASLEDGRLKLTTERVDVASLVAEATSIVAPLIHQRGQTLNVSAPPNLPALVADKQRVSQVLVNLLTNARKYAPEGTEISLSVEAKNGGLAFTVSDAGPGVPQEERERIFEPFYRIQKDGDAGSTGSGLGLAIAKSLVELHKGRIWVEDSPAGGASFVFSLPIEGANENSGNR